MTTEERLARLEAIQSDMRADLADIKRDVRALDRSQTRFGGILFGVACVAAFATWALSNVRSLFGILPS